MKNEQVKERGKNKKMEEKPNILIICTDQQRWDHLGFMNNKVLKTPNIDKLAQKGVAFTSCYTTCPACSPARATLLTGLTNRGHGLRMNGTGSIRKKVPSLPEILKNAGYRTHSAGKIHLNRYTDPIGIDISKEKLKENPERRKNWDQGTLKKSPDNYQGFETIDLCNAHVYDVFGDYSNWLEENHPKEFKRLREGSNYKGDRYPYGDLKIPEKLHYNNWIADKSIEFIKEHVNQKSDQPFFLWCGFPDPHAPFAAVEKWINFYEDEDIDLPRHDEAINKDEIPKVMHKIQGKEGLERMIYKNGGEENLKEIYRRTFAMISHMDEQLGRIINSLEETGCTENTVVVFVSDHGDQLGEHGLMHKNYWPFDGNSRVPMVINVPGMKNKSRKVEKVVSLLDIVPTLLDLAEVEYPDPKLNEDFYKSCGEKVASLLPGESLKPVIKEGKDPKRGNALIEFDDDLNTAFDLLQMRVLVTDDYKLCTYAPTGEGLLFDRKKDPLEINNLYNQAKYKDVVKEMQNKMLVQIMRTDNRTPRRICGY